MEKMTGRKLEMGKGVVIGRLHCRYHPTAELVEDYSAGDLVCSECGLVVGDRVIDVGSEWRTFNDDQGTGKDMCRVGAAEDPLYEEDLSTTIQGKAGDVGQFKKSTKQKAMQSSRVYIKELCDRMNIPKTVRDNAMYRYKAICDKNAMKGKDKEAVMATLVYSECRRMKLGRSIDDFCGATGFLKKTFSRVNKSISKMVDASAAGDVKKEEIVAAGDFVFSLCSLLSLTRAISNKAKAIVDKVEKTGLLGGCAPKSAAAAAIYLAAVHGECTKEPKDVAAVAGINEATIKKNLKLLMPHIKELLA